MGARDSGADDDRMGPRDETTGRRYEYGPWQMVVQADSVLFRTLVHVVRGEIYLPVVTDLRYDKSAPYSVCMIFNSDTDMTARWEFGRELLRSGQSEISGVGDVQVWPSSNADSGEVMISLRSGPEMAVVAISGEIVDAFLDQAASVVAVGEEADVFGLEEALSQLLGEK
ncbi:SsgA family sporulation/cell division regulator [Streptomyces sp. NPDC060030]|uniref:SsgA family sporulation/cell division regulator n=1 Tax=Streptomyces sp. NPDC060030 TaxID=3347042 RepID=UPI003690A6D4